MQLGFALAVIGALVPAANYYVNQSTGSDSNAGVTAGQPFATIAKLQSVITAGQLGAVYGGSPGGQIKYREQFTAPATNIGIVGYGAYSPLFDCSDAISAGSWAKTGGFTNVYQATITTANALGFLRLWENDVAFLRATSLANLDATTSRYYVSADPTGNGTVTFTMYVNASDSSNPGANGKTYEFNSRGQGVFSQYAAVASNIQTRRNLANNGSFEIGPGSLVTNITANDGTKHNALIHKASTYRNLTMRDSYYAGQPKIALVLNDNSPRGEDAWIENAQYIETVELTGVGFYGHTNIDGAFGLVTVKDSGTVGATASVNGFNSSGMTVDGGTFNAGITTGSTVNIIKNATVNGQIVVPYSVSVEIAGVVSAGSFTNGNIDVLASIAPSLNIHNSDLSNSRAFDGAIYISPGTSPTAFILQSNVFRALAQTNHIVGPGTANLPLGSMITGNTYHYPGTSSWILFRGTTYDISGSGWAAWQALGFDSTGARVTP